MTVETDASDHAIAGILSVTTQDNKIQPIAFFSCSLQGAEKNYNTHDKELLAMFKAFKNWRHFLEGSGKVINTVTNHKNLEYFMTSKKLSRQQARWAEFLAQFNMRVHFRPGRLGSKPDALTCRWDLYTDRDGQEPVATNVHPIFDSEHLAEDLVLACTGTVEEPTAAAGITMDSKAIDGDIAAIGAGDDFARKICGQIKATNHPEGTYRWSWKRRCPSCSIQPSGWFVALICPHIFLAKSSPAPIAAMSPSMALLSMVTPAVAVGSSMVPVRASTRSSARCSLSKIGRMLFAVGSCPSPS